MRALLVLTAALLAVLLLAAGCNRSTNAARNEATGGKAATKKIGLCVPEPDHKWMEAVVAYAKEQAKDSGVDLIVLPGKDPSAQATALQDLTTQKVDAIVLLPTESKSLTEPAKKVKDAKIPLVIFDREITSPDYDVLVKGDNVGVGKHAAEYLGGLLKGKGNIVQIEGVPCSVTDQRTAGFAEGIKQFPDMKIIDSKNGAFNREKSLTVMQNLLQAHKQIDAVYTQDDEMALGVLKAISDAKRTDIKVVTGAGGAKDVYKLIKDNDPLMKATFTYSPLMVKEAIKAAVDLANGKQPATKDVALPAEKVTLDNAASFFKDNAPY